MVWPIAFQSHYKVTANILVSIVSSYGLASDGTKQLTWTKHAEFLWNPCSAISVKMLYIIREYCK